MLRKPRQLEDHAIGICFPFLSRADTFRGPRRLLPNLTPSPSWRILPIPMCARRLRHDGHLRHPILAIFLGTIPLCWFPSRPGIGWAESHQPAGRLHSY